MVQSHQLRLSGFQELEPAAPHKAGLPQGCWWHWFLSIHPLAGWSPHCNGVCPQLSMNDCAACLCSQLCLAALEQIICWFGKPPNTALLDHRTLILAGSQTILLSAWIVKTIFEAPTCNEEMLCLHRQKQKCASRSCHGSEPRHHFLLGTGLSYWGNPGLWATGKIWAKHKMTYLCRELGYLKKIKEPQL